MVSEKEFCGDYITSQAEPYEREVTVGNCLLKEDETLVRGAQGSLSWDIDGLHSPSHSSEESLLECKVSPTFTGLGQLLTYSYLRRRDRDIVWQWYTARGSDWETKSGISGFESHVSTISGDNSRKTYQPKPQITEIDQRLIVYEIEGDDTPLLSVCSELGIDIDYYESGGWRSLDPNVFNIEGSDDTPQLDSWLTSSARETLDSTKEENAAHNFCELLTEQFGFEEVHAFREIPIGSHLYPSQPSPRADLVVKADGIWLVVEVKRSPSDRASQAFQKAFGQAAAYATLFSKEWNLPSEKVLPVVYQEPVAVLGDLYRRDRYDEDYQTMFQRAKKDMRQPVIIGPAGSFGRT